MLRKNSPPACRREEGPALRFLYGTAPGRVLLKLLCLRGFSRLCGYFLDTGASRRLIGPFVRRNGIDLSDYEDRTYASFNDFFTRRIKPARRPVDFTPEALTAPCDGLLSVYPIREDTVLPVKQSAYTVSSLLGSGAAAEKYRDGLCLVFRLRVDHYHRYCFPDGGEADAPVFLPGKLHTVRPIALAHAPVFTENCRAWTVLRTDHFGQVTQVEVGAMLVGRICNHPRTGRVERGEEKGMFLYGGSTVILLLEAGRVHLLPEFCRAAGGEEEAPVRLGQRIGLAERAGTA